MAKLQFECMLYQRMKTALLPQMDHFASQSPNAKYKSEDVYNVTLSQCIQNRMVAPTIRKMRRRNMRVMTRQRFLQLLGAVSYDETLNASADMLEASAREHVNRGRLRGKIKISVDCHRIARHDKAGKDHPDLKSGKVKDGSYMAEEYMTAQVASGKCNVTLAAYPIADGEDQSYYLGGIIENARMAGADVEVVLLDRGFNSVANMLEMIKQYVDFIMPLRGNDKIYGIMNEVHTKTGAAVRPYTMTANDGRTVTFTLVVCRKKLPPNYKPRRVQDMYVAFATNIKVENPKKLLRYIPKVYRARWGIEIGYRVLEEIRAKTKSPRTVARLFLLFFSLAFVNYWLLYKIVDAKGIEKRKDVTDAISDYADLLWLYMRGTYGHP